MHSRTYAQKIGGVFVHYDAMRDSHYGGGACIDIVIKKTFSATSKTNTANKGYPKKSILTFF